MQKHEVLSLLERFPDLVDSDDLLSDLYHEATGDTPGMDWKVAKPMKPAIGKPTSDDVETFPNHPR
jgi:hypothetical protein